MAIAHRLRGIKQLSATLLLHFEPRKRRKVAEFAAKPKGMLWKSILRKQ